VHARARARTEGDARQVAGAAHDGEHVARDLVVHPRGVDLRGGLAQPLGSRDRSHAVEVARADAAAREPSLITLGEPKVTSISPLGVYLEVPVTVAAVKQGGRVDFLTFEDMVVNGTPVTVDEYHHPFELPNDRAVTLPDPVKLYISTPRALFGALGEWSRPKDVWPVTGRVYVFGRFKKFFFTFKRVVPVELALSFRNPLRGKS
jgi:hypothetical protein